MAEAGEWVGFRGGEGGSAAVPVGVPVPGGARAPGAPPSWRVLLAAARAPSVGPAAVGAAALEARGHRRRPLVGAAVGAPPGRAAGEPLVAAAAAAAARAAADDLEDLGAPPAVARGGRWGSGGGSILEARRLPHPRQEGADQGVDGRRVGVDAPVGPAKRRDPREDLLAPLPRCDRPAGVAHAGVAAVALRAEHVLLDVRAKHAAPVTPLTVKHADVGRHQHIREHACLGLAPSIDLEASDPSPVNVDLSARKLEGWLRGRTVELKHRYVEPVQNVAIPARMLVYPGSLEDVNVRTRLLAFRTPPAAEMDFRSRVAYLETVGSGDDVLGCYECCATKVPSIPRSPQGSHIGCLSD
mmetsp:Transcript_12163/g.28857  ORF Transcript_12163/g.28857 Transcript_12163/m.28857 type:complete len:356 (+) Transcript_12163:95-1162(+)|eukprot:CAMPEP_0177601012 /NCGR_PEP_ID=MMETSP0419_2-20121207/13995_1 /TAXON_ID=582737 /ORGANISM="Tetraselmis sp., Strain GSL018" /LENGTH=355 /DNA_ID=CAMNT_0019094175 /DNA_START=69 /DNA_END=1136 /DNA_ORIENTATION=+